MASKDALVFTAVRLKELLRSRHSFQFKTDEIITWAELQARAYGAASPNPHWWIVSAIDNVECLDACFNMLKELRQNNG